MQKITQKQIDMARKFCFIAFSFILYGVLAIYAADTHEIQARFLLFPAIFFMLIIILVFAWKDDFYIMAIILAGLGILYFSIAPFQMIPDERGHFLRAFEISMGKLITMKLSDGNFGDILPRAIADCYNKDAIINWNDVGEISFSNTASYSFISYIPQTAGMFVVRHFTNKLALVYYAGRLFNFIAALSLSVWALKEIPFGRKILFLIMINPMTLQQMISLSPDAMANALSFAFIAFVLNCAYHKENIEIKDIVIIAAMLSYVALCKIVYIILFLLIYLIPNSKCKNKGFVYLLKIAVPVFVIFLNFMWLGIASRFLLSFSHNGSDSKEQIKNILKHPFEYVKTIVRTFFQCLPFYVVSCFGGSLGPLLISTHCLVWGGFLAVVIFHSACYNGTLVARNLGESIQRILFLGLSCAVFCAGSIFILTALYVQWSAVSAKVVDGVQGRYFIPLLPCLLLPVAYRNGFGNTVQIEKKSYYLFIIVLFLNFIALSDVCTFYPDALQKDWAAKQIARLPDLSSKKIENINWFRGVFIDAVNNSPVDNYAERIAQSINVSASVTRIVGWAVDLDKNTDVSAVYIGAGGHYFQTDYGYRRDDIPGATGVPFTDVAFKAKIPTKYLLNDDGSLVREIVFIKLSKDKKVLYEPVRYKLNVPAAEYIVSIPPLPERTIVKRNWTCGVFIDAVNGSLCDNDTGKIARLIDSKRKITTVIGWAVDFDENCDVDSVYLVADGKAFPADYGYTRDDIPGATGIPFTDVSFRIDVPTQFLYKSDDHTLIDKIEFVKIAKDKSCRYKPVDYMIGAVQ